MLAGGRRRRGTRPAAASSLGRRAGRPSRSGRRASVRRSACAAPPPGDPPVIARTQHLGHRPSPGTRPAACTAGTRADRFAERFFGDRRVVADHAGQQPGDRLDHDERRRLAAGQHEVADRELAVAQMIGDPLVDALVAAADQREPVAAPPARARTAWSKRRPLADNKQQRPRRLRRPRPRRTAAPASSPCPRRRRTARRRRCGAGRSSRRAGRAAARRARRARAPARRATPAAARRGTRERS